MKALRGTVSEVAKHKRIPAIVVEVLGNRLIAQLSTNGSRLIGIPFIGGPVSAGDTVYINYASGQPIAECRGEQVDNVAAQPVRSSKVSSITEFPQSTIGGPEGTGELHDHYHQYISQFFFTAEGELTQGWNPHKVYNQTSDDKTLLQVQISIGTIADDDIIVDIHKNGTTIFTDQNHRPVIPAGETAGFTEDIDVTSWQTGDYLMMCIDQVGSETDPGMDLAVVVVYELSSLSIDGPLIDLNEIADVTIDPALADQDVLIYDSGTGVWRNGSIGETQPAHASTHENGGDDEISVSGLSGVLADAQNADHLQGRDIYSGAPSDGQGLVWSSGNNRWEPGTVSSGSSTGGSSVALHASTHQSGGSDTIKLDDLATPDDNTDLNATTGYHGLLPKLSGGSTLFLRGDGEWAVPPGSSGSSSGGGLVLIQEVVSSGSSKYLEITNIPSTYKNLHIDFIARSQRSSLNNDPIRISFNGDTTDANYRRQHWYNTTAYAAADDRLIGAVAASTASASEAGQFRITILDYASTTYNHHAEFRGTERRTATEHYIWWGYIMWENTAAITTIRIATEDSNLYAGGIMRVWGEKEGSGGGGGSSDFLGLTDTPDSYSGQALKFTRVNAGETALEFASVPATSGSDIKLDDLATPDDNTDLNATTGYHGLLPKLSGGSTVFLRGDGQWAVPAISSSSTGLMVDWENAPGTFGQDQNRTTGGTYGIQDCPVTIGVPFYLTDVLWDIYSSGSYILSIRAGDSTGTELASIGYKYCAATSADNSFAPSSPIFLAPGQYSFAMTKSGAEVSWYDRNATSYVDRVWSAQTIYYDGVASDSYTPAIKLVGTPGIYMLGGTSGSSGGSGDMLKSIYDTNDDGVVGHANLADAAPWSGVTGKPNSYYPDAHKFTHMTGGSDVILLDDLGTPGDNTDLDATTGRHGLLPKLSGGSTLFLRGDGTWAEPPGTGTGSSGSTIDVLGFTSGGEVNQGQGGAGGNDAGYNYVDAVVLPHQYLDLTSVKITPGTTCNLKLIVKDHGTGNTLGETGYEAVTSGVEKTFTLSTPVFLTPYRWYRIGVQRDSGNWSAPYKNQVSEGGYFYFAGGYFGTTYYGGNPLNVTIYGTVYYGSMMEAGTGSSGSSAPSTPVTGTIQIGIDGGGSVPTTGVLLDYAVPFDMTITGWTVLATASGSITIDLWKDTYANFPPDATDTVTGSDKPRLSSQNKNTSSALTGWDTTWQEGDIVRVNIDSASILTRAVVSISYTRS